jgi:hypothetical protein
VNQFAEIFKIDKSALNLRRGVLIMIPSLMLLIVFFVLDQEEYFLSAVFALLILGVADPGGDYAYRLSHMAVFGAGGALLTALGVAVGDEAWGWAVLAAFVVTLLSGLAIKYGLHRYLAAVLLNVWFVIALALPVAEKQAHEQPEPWGQALAWLIGAALVLVYITVVWLVRGRSAQAQPIQDLIPGDTSHIALSQQVVLFCLIRALAVAIGVAIAWGFDLSYADWMPLATLAAMQTSFQQTTLRSEQRLIGALIGAVLAAALLLTVTNRVVLGVVICVLGTLALALRGASYTWYCAAVAGAVLIAIDVPHPTNRADEWRRVLWTFVGVGIGLVVMLLVGLLKKRATAKHGAPSQPKPQPT